MSNIIKFSITGDTNAEQVTNRAKTAVSGFDKQVEGIQKKFSTAFKDIFLGFTAPMVILNNAISMISGAIEKAKQDARDGLELIAKGETIYASSEEKKAAAFFKAKKARDEEIESVRKGRAEIAREFLDTKEGSHIAGKMAIQAGAIEPEAQQFFFASIATNPDFQKAALDAFLNSPEGKAYKPIFDGSGKGKDSTFKGPEGFGNVIGVGPNPVLEAMTQQTEVLQDIKTILQESKPASGGVPAPFTQQSPSRAALLR